jgi:signal transduction histidine kinase
MSQRAASGTEGGRVALSERVAVRLAWAIGALCIASILVSVVLVALDWRVIKSPDDALLSSFLSAAVVAPLGVLIVSRRPRHAIGWLLLVVAVVQATALVNTFLAIRALLSGAAPDGWVEWPAWVGGWTQFFSLCALIVVALLFPDGRPPSRRWRWAGIGVVVYLVAVLLGSTFSGGTDQLAPGLPSVPAPLDFAPVAGFSGNGSTPLSFLWLGMPVVICIAAAALIVRLRRARGRERQQLKWFVYVTGLLALAVVLSYPLGNVQPAWIATVSGDATTYGILVLVPGTIGVAIIGYGLYDIEVFVSRALVYGSLAVFITAVYVGIAVGIGTLVGGGGKPNLALSILATAIVAIGFQPVRERVQKVANRLVYGKRATPYEVLSEFSGRVAETYAADEVLPRMARVLQEGTGAESATVWLRGMVELRPAATFPVGTAEREPVPMTNGSLPSLPDSTRAVEVRHQGELLGALSVEKRRGETLTPIEQKLVDDLAHQAGLVLKNVGLSADLQARLDELRASRERLVHAQDLERRRLERNLHDGAQQHLVALKVKLGLAEMLLSRDPAKVAATLEQLKGDADEALETLRDLARGIYPPLLADKGLLVALESQARKATVPVTVEAVGVDRYPQDVEATVYFCVLEALQNVQKYASATHVVVRLDAGSGTLTFGITDDGAGFDTETAKKGAGLTNMSDRVDALGGTVEVTSRPGAGTRVRGALPVQARAEAVPA